jgi:diaminopimelate epimerase
MYNADGSRAEMCGNGLRCVARYLYDHRGVRGDPIAIETDSGVLAAWMVSDASGAVEAVTVDLGRPRLTAPEIPLSRLDVAAPILGLPIEVAGRRFEATCVSMGNPHAVIFAERIDELPLAVWGPAIERHPLFPRGANVEWVERLGPDRLRQRTWERGSGETMACGTGAGAVCVAAALNGLTGRRVAIELRGGEARLEWRTSDDHVRLTGPAVEVFAGVYR